MRWIVVSCLLMVSVSLNAQTSGEWIESANKKMSEGNSLGAIKDFTSALDMEPGNAEALAGRGIVHAELLDYEDALSDLGRAVAIDSQLAIAWFNLGYVYFQKKQFRDALSAYDRYVTLHPQDAGGYMARGEVRLHLGMDEAAMNDFRTYVSMPVKDNMDRLSVARAYMILDQPQKALEALNVCIQNRPEASEAYLQRAQIYANELEEYDKAIADYNIYLLEYPQKKEAYVGRGNAYFALNIPDAAIRDYSRALQLDPEDANLYMDRGYCYMVLEDYEASYADFGKALELKVGDHETAWYNKGISAWHLGKKEEACNCWQQAGDLSEVQRKEFCTPTN